MVGLPRSGKSTFIKDWQDSPVCFPRVVLCADVFREVILGQPYRKAAEPIVHAHVLTAARALIKSGYDVMIDECNTSKRSLYSIFEIDPAAEYVMVKTPTETCRQRALALNQGALLPVIDRAARQLAVLDVEAVRKEVIEKYSCS